MTIQNMAAFSMIQRTMGINQSALARPINRVSSGSQINAAADNAAGLAISERMRGQIGGLSQASVNTQHAVNLIQTAEGALDSTQSVLGRMRELAVQASSGILSDSDRTNINFEFTALQEEIDRISDATHFNSIPLLDGSLSGQQDTGEMIFQVGANGGADQRVSLRIDDMSASSLGVSGLDISTAHGAAQAIEALDQAIDATSGQRARLGATQNRMESTIDSLGVFRENMIAAESRIRDADLAREMMQFTARNMQMQATHAMASQTIGLSHNNMRQLLMN